MQSTNLRRSSRDTLQLDRRGTLRHRHHPVSAWAVVCKKMSRVEPQIRRLRTHRRSVEEVAADSRVLPGAARTPDTTVGAAEGSILPPEAGLGTWSAMSTSGGGQHGAHQGEGSIAVVRRSSLCWPWCDDGDEEKGCEAATCSSSRCKSALKCHSRTAFPRSNVLSC
jgi:hypothetical protein